MMRLVGGVGTDTELTWEEGLVMDEVCECVCVM